MSDRGDPQRDQLAARHRRLRRGYGTLVLSSLLAALLGGSLVPRP